MRKLLTGEPYAGKPPVRFGGRGDCISPTPIWRIKDKKGIKYLLRQIEQGVKIYRDCPILTTFLEDFYNDLSEAQKSGIPQPLLQESANYGSKITEEMLGSNHSLKAKFQTISQASGGI